MKTMKGLLIAAVLGGSVVSTGSFAAPADAGIDARAEGLVRMQSSGLDEVYLRPDANLQSYRKVIVDPGVVALRKGWLRSINSTRGPSRWLVPEDAQEITDEAATILTKAVTESFRARGYEIVTAPGPGVMRITPRVTDLWVNAPDVTSPNMQALFSVDAGEATLMMDVRDSESGAVLGQIVDRGTARELSTRINRTFRVTNGFWFDALFRHWSANCIASLEAGRPPA